MWRDKLKSFSDTRKNDPFFFWFASIVSLLFVLQFAIKTEITPLGYFSLYSDPAYPQETYRQLLPANPSSARPVNIYQAKGAGFLMLEILPTRYDILMNSDHCNQMNHKLQRFGLHDNNSSDCRELEKFGAWLPVYMGRIGMAAEKPVEIWDYGFKDGKLIDVKPTAHAR